MTSIVVRRLAGLMALVVLALSQNGCSDSKDSDPKPDPYLVRTSPDNVLNNLQVAWRLKNIEGYSKLLASDFRFYFDNQTRTDKGLPAYWTAAQESTQVGKLFGSTMVSDISVSLNWPLGTAHPVTEAGRESWVYLDVLDIFLDVDIKPTTENPDGVTYRVEDQKQRYYFRRGKSVPAAPGDTLFYLVEWRDYGAAGLLGSGGLRTTADQSTSWGGIKSLFR